jgi:hypothetical protein
MCTPARCQLRDQHPRIENPSGIEGFLDRPKGLDGERSHLGGIRVAMVDQSRVWAIRTV